MGQTKQRNETKPKVRPGQGLAEDGTPFDEKALRASILRKLAIIADEWRDCPERACRRHRTCASPRLLCLKQIRERRPVSPEKEAEAMAWLQRALKRRRAEQCGAR
jgi:hypothetical protein